MQGNLTISEVETNKMTLGGRVHTAILGSHLNGTDVGGLHERAWLHSSVDRVVIKAVLETRGPEHNRNLLRELVQGDYPEAAIEEEGESGGLRGQLSRAQRM